MKKIFILIGSSFSLIYPNKVRNIISSIINYLSTGFYRGCFKSIGDNTIITPPRLIKNAKYISIGNNSSILNGICLTCIDDWYGYKYSPSITIGDNVSIGRQCHISAINSIIIEDGVLIGGEVTITDHSHGETYSKDVLCDVPSRRRLISKGRVRIGKNVWIGDKVTIVAGVNIGEGCVVGANSVVTHDLPAYSICGGIPARIINHY